MPTHSPVCAWKCRFAFMASLFVSSLSIGIAADPAWLRVETPGFVVYSDAVPSDIKDIAVEFSAYQHAFREFFGAPGHALPPATLILFQRATDFAAHAPAARSEKTTLVNYSVDVDGTALLALAVSADRYAAVSRTFEFETIWALRRMGYYLPLWLAQGAGEVFSTADVAQGRCLIGRQPAALAEQYAAGPDEIPWERFFAIGEQSPEYAGDLATGAFHAQAWALMHWVLLKDEHTSERFQTLVTHLKSSPSLEAVQAVTGERAETFRQAIQTHLREYRAARSLAFDAKTTRAGLTLTPAAPAEVLVLTSNLLAAAGRFAECNAELERARALVPDRPDVKEAWARRALRENHPEEATRLYREAIAAGSRNFAAYLNSADARLNLSSVAKRDAQGSGGAETQEAVKEIRHAIELHPGSAEAYRLLGRAFWLLPAVSPELVSELSQGVAPGAAGSEVRYYRALLNSRLGRNAECIGDLEQVIADPDASMADRERARERLSFVRYVEVEKKVNELVAAKHFDDARRILGAATSSEADTGARERYRPLQAFFEEEAAWANLVSLGEAARWSDLENAANAFQRDFPHSRHFAAAGRLASEGRRLQPPAVTK